jgi:uncharacterized membrane-anchored protein YhcB (DUF1043 family)
MLKIAGSIYNFVSKNSSIVLIIVVFLLANSSIKQCQRVEALQNQVSSLEKQREEIVLRYNEIASAQRKIAEELEAKLLLIEDKYKDKQEELLKGIKSLKEEYLVDEAKVIEFLLKFDIIGGQK